MQMIILFLVWILFTVHFIYIHMYIYVYLYTYIYMYIYIYIYIVDAMNLYMYTCPYPVTHKLSYEYHIYSWNKDYLI